MRNIIIIRCLKNLFLRPYPIDCIIHIWNGKKLYLSEYLTGTRNSLISSILIFIILLINIIKQPKLSGNFIYYLIKKIRKNFSCVVAIYISKSESVPAKLYFKFPSGCYQLRGKLNNKNPVHVKYLKKKFCFRQKFCWKKYFKVFIYLTFEQSYHN